MTDLTRLIENTMEATVLYRDLCCYLLNKLAYSLYNVVKQDLSVSTDFDHVVKFCIQHDVDGPCQSFGEMNIHT
jgi:hypothetical protein